MSDEKRTTQVFGTYVVWGSEKAPEVHMLDESGYRRYCNFPSHKRLLAIQAVFGAGMDTAIPAWSMGAMEMMALSYEGAHQERVRYICAAIALGKPYGPNEPGDELPPDGGTKVPVPKGPKPRGPRPQIVQLIDEVRA